MRWILAIVSGIVAAAILAPVCFFVALILAGPHSSLLPSAIQPAVLVMGWIVFLGAPLLVARTVWRRASGRRETRPGV